jgi:anti-sigma factor RsiW
MSTLNDDNFESILSGDKPVPPELADDAALERRLATHRALKDRLHKAFDDVAPDAAFAERLRQELASADPAKPASQDRRRVRREVRFRMWPLVAAAAVVVLVAIPLGVLLLGPEEVMAARKEFARLHALHETGDAALFHDEDPARMAAHLKKELSYDATVRSLAPGETVRGCCVDRFRGRKVASYVLETPHGVVSIIVSSESPEQLQLRHRIERSGRTLWRCRHGNCRIAGIVCGERSYYAVGDVPPEVLTDLLLRVAPTVE